MGNDEGGLPSPLLSPRVPNRAFLFSSGAKKEIVAPKADDTARDDFFRPFSPFFLPHAVMRGSSSSFTKM